MRAVRSRGRSISLWALDPSAPDFANVVACDVKCCLDLGLFEGAGSPRKTTLASCTLAMWAGAIVSL